MKKHFRRALKKGIVMPLIPVELLNNKSIARTLYSTINEFSFNEQTVIYLYCALSLPIKEIGNRTAMPGTYVKETLLLFSESLSFKLYVFEVGIDTKNYAKVSIRELFELEQRGTIH